MSKLVLVESPFRAITEAPTDYVVRSMRDAFSRGEFPFASHRLYPGVLDDNKPSERDLGIEAGLEWGRQAVETLVYCDHGISIGMAHGIARAVEEGRPVVLRALDRPEAVGAFARILHLTQPAGNTVDGLLKQLEYYRVALEAEKAARREDQEKSERMESAWCDRWDAAAEAMGVTSDELARRASVMRGKKSNGAAALPEGAFG